jgi:thiol-disulfide isomerase/thioredoxin
MGILLSMLLAASTTLLPLSRAVDWLGRAPAPQSFAGKVVVVDVFTFDCINCKHVVSELRSLRKSIPQSDLLIVGIHSPETPFERNRASVIQNLSVQGITWPVAIDNSFALWKAYGIQYWPTQLIFDRSGVLRKTIIGEGQDTTVDSTVHQLLGER